jgi:hypothetical protein
MTFVHNSSRIAGIGLGFEDRGTEKGEGATLHSQWTKVAKPAGVQRLTVLAPAMAAAAFREKLRDQFGARHPAETGIILSGPSTTTYTRKSTKPGRTSQGRRKETDRQRNAVNAHFSGERLPSGFASNCRIRSLNALLGLKIIQPQKMTAEILRAQQTARAQLCGTALRSPGFIPEQGFRSHKDIENALKEKGLIALGMLGVSGRDVLLLPEILEHPELGPVGDAIAMSVVLDFLDNGSPGSEADLRLALQHLGQDVDFSAAGPPGVAPAASLEVRILDALASKLMENGQTGRLLDRLDRKRVEVGQLMEDAAKGDESKEAATRTKQGAETAVSGLRSLTRALLKEAADKALSEADPDRTLGVIVKTLDDLAGEEGKAFADTVALGVGADLARMKEAVKVLEASPSPSPPPRTEPSGQQFFLELPEDYSFGDM